jgi:ribosomal peptide maturation radical SAM protein 1
MLFDGPSISIGVLKRSLTNAGFSASSVNLDIEFFEYLIDKGVVASDSDYSGIPGIPRRTKTEVEGEAVPAESTEKAPSKNNFATGGDVSGGVFKEWVFSENDFSSLADEFGKEALAKMDEIRVVARGFLDTIADEIIEKQPKVVGLSLRVLTFLCGIGLAKRIKDKAPHIKIVVGGTSTFGVMGEGIAMDYPCVDYVFHGEGEREFPRLIKAILEDDATIPSGVSYRKADGALVLDGRFNSVNADEFLIPDYDEFMERAAIHNEEYPSAVIDIENLAISFENSRGCWWGQKHLCKFCAMPINKYRTKPWEVAMHDLLTLVDRYQHFRVRATEDLIDFRYIETLLPALAESGYQLSVFNEIKANFGLKEMIALRSAGVVSVQPGVESFSSNVLKQINKGVTPVQNVRMLKFATMLGLNVKWGLLYSIPGELPTDYDGMDKLIPRLVHLCPPTFMSDIELQRFSPYFEQAKEYGINIKGPHRMYHLVYPATPNLDKIAASFEFEHCDGKTPEVYVKPMVDAAKNWQSLWPASMNTLIFRRLGKTRLIIIDERPTSGSYSHYKFGEGESAIYNRIFDIASIQSIKNDPAILALGLDGQDVEDFMTSIVDEGLAFRDGDKVIGLALPYRDETTDVKTFLPWFES